MDKLSLYDFLSFLLPGFIAVEWARFLYTAAGLPLISSPAVYTYVELGFILLCVSFFTGLAIHCITFWAIRLKWYKRLIFQPAGPVMKKSNNLRPALPRLEKLCAEKYGRSLFHNKGELAPGFYDEAYFTLEGTDKMNSIKGFQSIYFFLRNVFTLCCIAIPTMLLAQVWLLISVIASPAIWIALLITTVIALLCLPLAHFSRKKMIDRLFWTYCTLQSGTASKETTPASSPGIPPL